MHTKKLLAAALLAVTAAAAAVMAGTAQAAPQAAPPAPATVDLPVVGCPTTFGVPPTTAPARPALRPVAVPAAMAARLSVYADTEARTELVAPRGWSCTAIDATDGSGGVAVYPHGEKLPREWSSDWPLARTSAASAVIGLQTSACYGCTLSQACRVFPAAAAAIRGYLPCPARPAAEKVTPIAAGIAGFVDPPGTAGDGVPSGGQYSARGVMTYHPRSADGSWMETCTLPAADAAECTAILTNFLTWYGQR
jgi:hypothetical protein